MKNVANIKQIQDGVFHIKINGEQTKANVPMELVVNSEIIPDITNTDESYMVIFIHELNKEVKISGKESLILDESYFDLLSLLQTNEEEQIEVQEEQANADFLKSVENLEATASGTVEPSSTNNPDGDTFGALNYDSEFQLSSTYESANLQDLNGGTNLNTNINANNNQYIPSNFSITTTTNNLIEENVSTDTVVAIIDVTDLNNSNNPIILSIADSSVSDYLQINQETGEVTLTQKGVDAINSDEGVDLDSLVFDVIVSDGLNETTKPITSEITRVDDNAPILSLNETNDQTEGSISTSTVVARLSATDLDDNTTITYSIKPSVISNYFTVDNNGVVTLSSDGVNAINSDVGIDITSLTFSVQASDVDHTVEKEITFDITRVDDNPTIINNITTNPIVEESVTLTPNMIVAQIDASDLDDTPLEYTLEGTHANLLEIDNNGVIRLNDDGVNAINLDTVGTDLENLDFTVGTDLENLDFTVVITDPISGNKIEEDMNLNVTRVNDNPAQITIDSINQNITEQAVSQNTIVANISSVDLDGDTVNYSIKPSSTSSYFDIDANGVVRLTDAGANAINSDIGVDITNLTFAVVADDGTHTVEENISFDITRVDDNAPTMTLSNQQTLEEENITTDTQIASISTNDLDDNSNVTYEIANDSPNQNYFIINNGVLQLSDEGKNAINDDSGVDITSLDVKLDITDGTNTSSETITVSITRTNDNAPILSLNETNDQTEGSISTSTVVARLSATDLDDNTTITYSIKPSVISNYFTVDNNGVVTLSSDGVNAINSDVGIDITSLTFSVQASDVDHTVEKEITFDITRINDIAPTLNIDSQNRLEEQNVQANDIIAQLVSSDLDDNTTFTYDISSDSPNKTFFTINNNGQVLLTQAGVDAINDDSGLDLTSFDIKVEVNDGIHTATKEITVAIDRNYDSIPEITMSSFAQITQQVNSPIQAGDTVMEIEFTDLDDNDDVTYSITNGNANNYFEIDNNSDKIIITQNGVDNILDIINASPSLQITATDKGNNQIVQTLDVEALLAKQLTTDNDADGYNDGSQANERIISDGVTPIDGKAGLDTLILENDASIDLTGIVKNIENIDLRANGSHTINEIIIDDVINSTDSNNNELIIFGGFDDSVTLKNDASGSWQNDGEVTENGITFTQYSDVRDSGDPTVVLKVASDIDTQVV